MINDADVMDSLVNGGDDAKWKDWQGGSGETWNFKEDKVLIGVFKGSHPAETKFGPRTVYEVETPDHKQKDVWETAQIRRFFNSLDVGAELRIEYLGKGETKNGQMVNQFKFQTA